MISEEERLKRERTVQMLEAAVASRRSLVASLKLQIARVKKAVIECDVPAEACIEELLVAERKLEDVSKQAETLAKLQAEAKAAA